MVRCLAVIPILTAIIGLAVIGSASAQSSRHESCRQFVGSVCAIVGGQARTFANACVARRMGGSIVRRGPCLRRGSVAPYRTPRLRGSRVGRRDGRRGGRRITGRRYGGGCPNTHPVCARWRGAPMTFATICHARAVGASVLRLGLCSEPSTPEARAKAAKFLCAQTRNPVCAEKNGKRRTYRNACLATVDLAVVVSRKACPAP